MAVDLMQMIKGAATQQVMDKLGGSLGMDSKKASSAFGTASATVLGGLLKKASSPDGGKSIFDLVKKADVSVLDKVGDLFGGGAASESMQQAGGGMLDTILGGNKASTIATLAKVLGLDATVVTKLLAMVAPFVMGILGKQVLSQGLDAAGLGSLLSSQKSSLVGLLPGNLTNDLGLSNLLGDATKAAGGVASAASSATASAARNMSDSAPSSTGGLAKILLPLLLLGVGGFFLWQTFFKPAANEVAQTANTAQRSTENIGTMSVIALEKGKRTFTLDSVKDLVPKFDMDLSALGENGATLKSGFEDITSGLAGLTGTNASESTATEFIEKIKGFSEKVDGLGLDKLDGMAKTASSGLIGAFLGSVDKMLEKVPAPLRGIVEPAVKSLVEKLTKFK